MRWAEHVTHIIVISTPVIGVHYNECNGRTRTASLKYSGKELHFVLLVALRGYRALPRATTQHFTAHELLIDGHPGRETVEHTAYGSSMRLAESRETQQLTDTVHAAMLYQ
jgi:hypothetical protein